MSEDRPMSDEVNIQIAPGEGGKDRLFAAAFDNLIIFVVGMLGVMAIPNDQVVWRGVVLIATYLGYFFWFEALVGSTPGKIFFGLWVRRAEGGRCSWQQAAVRTLMRALEVNPFLFGALPAGVTILASPHKQRLGDMIAGTVVRRGRSV